MCSLIAKFKSIDSKQLFFSSLEGKHHHIWVSPSFTAMMGLSAHISHKDETFWKTFKNEKWIIGTWVIDYIYILVLFLSEVLGTARSDITDIFYVLSLSLYFLPLAMKWTSLTHFNSSYLKHIVMFHAAELSETESVFLFLLSCN